MRLLPKRASSHRAACATSLHRSSAGAAGRCCQSRLARVHRPDDLLVSKRAREPVTITASVSRLSARGLPKICRRGQRRRRLDHRVPLRAAARSAAALADALDEGVLPADEEGHVGTQRGADREQALAASPGPTAGSARAARWPRRNCRRPGRRPRAGCLSIVMSTPSGCRWPACSGARHAGTGRRRAGRAEVVALQPAVVAPFEVQRVAPVDQHEGRLQQVVAVGASADHVQEQVQLGRRRQVVQGCAGLIASRRTRTVTLGARRARHRACLRRCRSGRPTSPAARSHRRCAGGAHPARAGRQPVGQGAQGQAPRPAPRATGCPGRHSGVSPVRPRSSSTRPGDQRWRQQVPSGDVSRSSPRRLSPRRSKVGADAAGGAVAWRPRAPTGGRWSRAWRIGRGRVAHPPAAAPAAPSSAAPGRRPSRHSRP
jgi:hypothetical protein